MASCRDCERQFHSICVQYMKEIDESGYLCDGCLKARSQKRKDNKYSARRELHCISVSPGRVFCCCNCLPSLAKFRCSIAPFLCYFFYFIDERLVLGCHWVFPKIF